MKRRDGSDCDAVKPQRRFKSINKAIRRVSPDKIFSPGKAI
jgi:hypothetical protein